MTPHMRIFLPAKVPIVSSARLRSRLCELHTASYKLGKAEETTANMQHNALPVYVLFVSTPALDFIKCLASLETPFLSNEQAQCILPQHSTSHIHP